MTALAAILAALATGYGLGRWQPWRRLSDWANWHRYGKRPTGPRRWAVYAVLSAENIVWLIAHPVQGWDAWKHRHDPPPARGPALTFTTRTRAPEEPTR